MSVIGYTDGAVMSMNGGGSRSIKVGTDTTHGTNHLNRIDVSTSGNELRQYSSIGSEQRSPKP